MKGEALKVAVLFTVCVLREFRYDCVSMPTRRELSHTEAPARVARNTSPVCEEYEDKDHRGKKTATATLEDNESARDFASLLPLKLSLRDYNSTEKIADLPRKLSTAGAPDGIDPSVGDLTYYAPWGNLAIFYKDFDYSKGLIKLGTVDSGLDVIQAADSGEITIEPVK